jgi:hypothetical protein
MMLRRQNHAAALGYCQRKIEAKQKMLDDVQCMIAKVEEEDLLAGYYAQENMWLLLDKVVWHLVDEIEAIDRRVKHVLKLNKDKDEDEAWVSWWSINDEEFDWVQGRRNSPLPVFFGASS